jgi:acetyltransferase-like isoleucine patch superfamily enzyme
MSRPVPSRFHATALVESDRIGEGTVIWAFAHIMPGAVIGRHCKIGDHVFIESGVTVGDNVTVKNGVSIWDHVHVADNVFLGPDAVLTNDRYPRRADVWTAEETWIEEGVTVGANATIMCGVRLGRRSFIAAGSVVTSDVPPHALVVGTPARQQGWVCHCGRPLETEVGARVTCKHCGRQYDITSVGITERP